MSDKYKVGDTVEGVVTGVQPYGAFVTINEETQGLIHISEVTNGFVKDITDHVTEGDKVKVKIIEINPEDHKMALSIRAIEGQILKDKKESAIADKKGTHGFATLKNKLKEWIEEAK
ncbi:CvfD/Ygs/GSP13 family RNA-binding post-transcriptional regulator [Gracilibacillus alcaliphilus]|uniref:CvfD/Ygs/GSP13 family RNA-binding post-transcriptional regulator n=1 Tax=Gracilibacillus alcaliphilus TaxID=1401441 RepID=UPI001958BFE3|nr:CvfD/Ygs/GSP13 family RNA-binding post-transcriptional regulator [Gracilibacillus alcaliphilus]MBM7675867.1 general stress protein 13 [Gracilibacillus alcaliphilus]